MATDLKAILATEVRNFFNKDVCCYVCVSKRGYTPGKDPNLEFSKASSVQVNLLNRKMSQGVQFYFESTLPAYILKKTEDCMSYRMSAQMSEGRQSTGNEPDADVFSSPAYKVKMIMGKYKGMTPAEALLKDGKAAQETLISVYGIMSNNLADPAKAQYRKTNEAQMAAIAEAAALKKAGKLQACATSKTIVLWDGMRTPNVNKIDERGLTDARTAKITFDTDPTNPEPYRIEIMNCKARPVQGAMVGASLKDAKDVLTLYMDFSEEAWYGLWRDVVDAKGAFSRTVESERVQYSVENVWSKEKGAKNAGNGYYPENNFYPEDPAAYFQSAVPGFLYS